MQIPQYVTRAKVQRVCLELGISDWSTKSDDSVDRFEAEVILRTVNTERLQVELDGFVEGLRVELEHGTRFLDANVTNNHPLLTGMIVLAHLHESLDYYLRIAVAELEGDLLGAIAAADPRRTREAYRRLLEARQRLDRWADAALGS